MRASGNNSPWVLVTKGQISMVMGKWIWAHRSRVRVMALLLAAAMMLDHCQLAPMATRLRKAIDDTLNVDKVRTGDLGGKASTAEFTQALVNRITKG